MGALCSLIVTVTLFCLPLSSLVVLRILLGVDPSNSLHDPCSAPTGPRRQRAPRSPPGPSLSFTHRGRQGYSVGVDSSLRGERAVTDVRNMGLHQCLSFALRIRVFFSRPYQDVVSSVFPLHQTDFPFFVVPQRRIGSGVLFSCGPSCLRFLTGSVPEPTNSELPEFSRWVPLNPLS